MFSRKNYVPEVIKKLKSFKNCLFVVFFVAKNRKKDYFSKLAKVVRTLMYKTSQQI